MKKAIKKLINDVRGKLNKATCKVALINKNGSNYVDEGVKVLIAIVIGALLLGGLYLLFDSVIMPEVTKRIQEMFNYKG